MSEVLRYHINQRVWVPHPHYVWITGTIVQSLEDGSCIVRVDSEKQNANCKIEKNNVFPVNATSNDDITGLNYHHEPGIVYQYVVCIIILDVTL